MNRWPSGLAGAAVVVGLVLLVAVRLPSRPVAPTPIAALPSDGWDALVSGSWHLLAFAIPLLLLALALIGLYALVVHVRRRASLPTVDGRVPLARSDHELAADALRRLHATHLAHAQAQAVTVPERLTLTDSRRLSVSNRQDISGPAPEAVVAPTAAELLRVRAPLVFGVAAATGEPAMVEPGAEVTSVGVVGQPNYGKSNTAAWLALYILREGGTVALGDPHHTKPRSLARRLAPLGLEAARTPREILRLVKQTHADLQRRKREGGPWPLLALLVDEWTSLLRSAEVAGELAPAMADIVSEGQGYGVITILLAQDWRAAAVGGSLRGPIPTTIVHHCRTEDARWASGLPGELVPRDVHELAPGEAYLVGDGVSKILVPRVEAAELAAVGGSGFDTMASAGFRPGFPGLRVVGAEGTAQAAEGRPEGREAEILRAIRRVGPQPRMADILRQLHGRELSGQPYQQASAEVLAAVARWLPAGE